MGKNSLVDDFTPKQLKEIVENSSSFAEIQRKLGYLGSGNNTEAIKKRCLDYGISLNHLTGQNKAPVQRTEENVFCENSTASQTVLRRWYKKNQDIIYKCAICGQGPLWNNKELTLTLDHINGINNDNRLDNLRWVCPNCDRQLDTFGSKNKNHKERYNMAEKNFCKVCGKEISAKSSLCSDCSRIASRKAERPNRDEFKKLVRQNSFSELGRRYNVCSSTISKWCKAYDLPFRKTEIDNYSQEAWDLL